MGGWGGDTPRLLAGSWFPYVFDWFPGPVRARTTTLPLPKDTQVHEPMDGPDTLHGVADATLGGYMDVHGRPPAFQGPDGHPYTVSVEVSRVASLSEPWEGVLVFPRWATNGLGIVGHVETAPLWTGRNPDDVRARAGALPLEEVKRLLDEAILLEQDDLTRDRNGGVS